MMRLNRYLPPGYQFAVPDGWRSDDKKSRRLPGDELPPLAAPSPENSKKKGWSWKDILKNILRW